LRTYFAERFDLPRFAVEEPDLSTVAQDLDVDPAAAETLAELIATTDVHTFARSGEQPARLEKRSLIDLVRKFERKASRSPSWCVLLLLPALLVPLSSRAASPEETLEQARRLFDEANEAALVDPAKSRRLYELAADRFQSLAEDHGITNGFLYYNTGNTYFLAGDLGRAILYFLRARQYIPANEQLRKALHEARLQQVDHFPRALPTQLRKTLLFWHYRMGPRGRLLLLAAASSALWGILALELLRPLPWKWNALGVIAIVIGLVGGSSLVHARTDPRRQAVIVQAEILPRKGGARVYDPAFTNPLHSGAEVTILEQRRDWLRIRVADGSEGWVPESAAERVLTKDEEGRKREP